jgi:methylaspartate mutase sigma subunit
MTDRSATVIIGVAASDAHAVANRLIELRLAQAGYEVINLGPCTSIAEFADCLARHPDAIAVAIGSLNGHAVQDLSPLRAARAAGQLGVPVIVGGNLAVTAAGRVLAAGALRELGVDYVLDGVTGLVPLLDRLAARSRHPAARAALAALLAAS